jgi:hypothetical protein
MAIGIPGFWLGRSSIKRSQYFAIGLILFAFKHLIDRIVASVVFGLPWSIFNYWVVGAAGAIDNEPLGRLKFYGTLVAVALPFIYIGVVATLGRLRDAGWPLWLVAAFFFPVVNILFFLLLSAAPSREDKPQTLRVAGFKGFLDRVIPRSDFGSAVAGVLATTLLIIGMTLLSVRGLGSYGWGLFIGLPFCLGLISVLVYGYHEPRPLGKCLLVALLSVGLASTALIAVAIEGLICVAMAAPLGSAIAVFGGFIGYVIQRRSSHHSTGGSALHAFSIVLMALPVLMLVEKSGQVQPSMREVRTEVEINAPPEEVWQQLVAFAELPPPGELLFKTGIAYPIRATIEGRGVGAVRDCVFSTGAFVEPIEVWDEPRLLKFGVTSQPAVMEELSPYSHLQPPHLNSYLQSRQGQFLLTRLPNGQTLLEGTTWYQNSFWPATYWGLWSDYIIHRIHQRVLDHIKSVAEQRSR